MVVKVTVSGNNSLLIEATKETLDTLDKAFTAPDFSDCFVYGKFHKEYMKMVHMMIRSKETPTLAMLPIGFLADLESLLKKYKAVYKIFDKRQPQKFSFTDEEIKQSLGYIELREHQVNAVKNMFNSINGVIKATTSAGKTEIFISYCKLTKMKTLILFARIDLAKQTLKRMKKAGLDAGIVQGNNVDEDHQVVMATVQSGHKLSGKYDCIIVDECHRASSDQYQVLLCNKHTLYRFGFSATPFVKKDKLKTLRTKAWLGSTLFEVCAPELMEKGYIAKPFIHMVPIKKPDDIQDQKWPFCETLGIIENPHRNKIIAELANNLPGQTLILVQKVDHGERLTAMINNAYFLYGESEIKEREEVVKRFDSGEPIRLIASTIFDEGISIDCINNVIVAGGGQSFVKTLQRLGRGLRITEGKTTVDFYDFYDTTNPTLEKHSKERIKTYREEGFTDITVFKIEEWRESYKII